MIKNKFLLHLILAQCLKNLVEKQFEIYKSANLLGH